MPIYDFTFAPKSNRPTGIGAVPELAPLITPTLPELQDGTKENDLLATDLNISRQEVIKETLEQGFKAMDGGVKHYFEQIQVPTADNTRPLTVRVAGGDKTFLYWTQDLRSGRIQLPVLSVNRTAWRRNEQKFSPPYIPMTRKMAKTDGSRMVLTYRPWPCLIDYTLSFWTERKRDMEYIMQQVLIRFNPLAEFKVQDEGGLVGNVQMRLGECTDNSDIDIGAEDLAKVRYDVNITIEGWLPLPEKVLPTVLGKVATLHDQDGKFLEGLPGPGVVTDGFFKSPRSGLI
jgi:hypothetical protein